MKKFIITIDTEGDNLWSWKPGDKITTENTLFLERFQSLANRFGFKPVWLSNFEMLSDERFVKFLTNVENSGSGEAGMHLHAWSTPPAYQLDIVHDEGSYLIEYPEEIVESKIATMTKMIEERIGVKPVSHRAGRWAMNDIYIKYLEKYGYLVDCSVTPHIDWSDNVGQTVNSAGSNYRNSPEEPYKWGSILEVPMSIKITHHYFSPESVTVRSTLASGYHAVKGTTEWLRPNGQNLKRMKWLADKTAEGQSDYLMFMLHSSELMSGGSPTFKTRSSIEKLYADLEALFEHISQSYEGCTLREYYHETVMRGL